MKSRDGVRKGRYRDIKGVPEAVMDRFSSRRAAIEKLYDSKRAKGDPVTPALHKKAGIMTRKPKTGQVDLDACRKLWAGQLTPAERDAFRRLKDPRSK